MFKNFFITAFRNFRRNKIFTVINIAGLSIGISAALVIWLIVSHELSYEKFHKDGDRIYRVVTDMKFPDFNFTNGGIPGPLPAVMKREIPGIEASIHFWMENTVKTAIPGEEGMAKEFRRQEKIMFAGEEYFSFIPYKWLAGAPAGALSGPNKVVLTESRAQMYFPGVAPAGIIGRVIIYKDSLQAKVTGVVKDLDAITDFQFKEFVSLPTLLPELIHNGFEEWGSVNSASQCFIRLKPGIDPKQVERTLADLREKHAKNAYLKTIHYLQPLHDMHFSKDFNTLLVSPAHKPTLYGLLAVAAFLLFLGCINFINLTTAQAAQRAKEIGIRKTIGGSRRQLIVQFLSETVLLTAIAGVVSLAIAPAILKIFAEFIPENLQFNLAKQPQVIVFMLVLIAVVGLLAGLYPAMVLSGYKPVLVLKNNRGGSGGSRRVIIRKMLTVSQFVIAQFFVIATLVVGKQIRFALNKDLGYQKEAILNFSVGSKQEAFREKLAAIPGIQLISLGGTPPASQSSGFSTMKYVKDGKEIETTVEIKQADTNYFRLYNMKLLAGRNLQPSDTVKEYVVNEAYARFLGFSNPADIVGTTIGTDRKIPVVGLLADFHTKSVHQAIKPLAYTCQQQVHRNFHILLAPKGANTDHWKQTIANMEKAWREFYPKEPFEYAWFDESIAQFYKKEQRTAALLQWSAGLTVFISCLGLLGLVIYTTHQRTKEIGIRKVLGASVMQIVALLSKDFMWLVLLAFIIAAPLAWWAMNNWLEDFAYRTTIGWTTFVISGAAMLMAALITLSIRTIRSVSANPVGSLRSE